jgi:Transposase and inactivated derivatives
MAIREINRYQLVLENQLEDWVSQDNPVRFISALVIKFYQGQPKMFKTDKGHKKTGRRAYHPAAMLMLFLYGYLHRINSSRRLEAETYRNMEVIWLIGNEHPDHKTISDFRKDNAKLIYAIAKQFRLFLKAEGFINGSIQAYDGTKVKALAKREYISLDDVKKRISEMESHIESYLELLNTNDRKEESDEQSPEADLEVLRLKAQIETLTNQLKEQNDLLSLMEKQESKELYPNDPDARKMKTLEGYIPGYNVQIGVDSEHMMITSDFVSTDSNDQRLLSKNVESSKEQIEIYPSAALADKGYATTDEITAVEANEQTTCFVAIPETAAMKKEAKGITFNYDEQEDCFYCTQGQKLIHVQDSKDRNGQPVAIYNVRRNPCKICSLFGICTKNSQHGKKLEVKNNAKKMIEYRNRSKSEQYTQMLVRRKAIIEHVFGTIKIWMGKIPLLLKTKTKVQIEIDLYATCYNLRRLFNVCPMSELLHKLETMP